MREGFINESTYILNHINRELTSEHTKTLDRGEFAILSQRICAMINKTVNKSQTKKQLDKEKITVSLKGLFEALMEFIGIMIAYSREYGPDMILKLLSIISGITMVGGAVGGAIIFFPMTSIGTTSIGTTLLMLASFISTPVTIGVGIYCLKKGGVPVEAITYNMGHGLLQCLIASGQRAAQGLQFVTRGAAQGICMAGTATWDNLVNIAGHIVTSELVDFEIDGSQSSAASRASDSSVALRNLYHSAEHLIAQQSKPIEYTAANLGELSDGLRAPPVSPISQPGSPRSPLTEYSEEFEEEFDLESQQNVPKRQRRDEDGPGGASSGNGGGRRKTKRNKKSKKCKKAKKGGKRNKTKKHKKHHKTLKNIK